MSHQPSASETRHRFKALAMALVPSAPLDLSGASEEDIKQFLASISTDERQKVMDALKLLKSSTSEASGSATAGSWMMQATDGEWGFYLIKAEN